MKTTSDIIGAKALKNRKYFENVKPRGDTIEWEKGEDVAPENLYYKSIPINKERRK